MAQQENLIKFKGKIGNLIGYRVGHEYYTRSSRSVKQTDNTKTASAVFKESTKWNAIFRNAYPSMIKRYADRLFYAKCNGVFAQILYSSIPNASGEKLIANANLELLKKLELNSNKHLDSLVRDEAHFSYQQDGSCGIILSIPNTADYFKGPTHANKAELNFCVLNLPLEGEDFEVMPFEPLQLALSPKSVEASIPFSLDLVGLRWIIVIQSIRFLDGGGLIGDARYRAAKVIASMGLKDGELINYVAPEPKPMDSPVEVSKIGGWVINTDKPADKI